MGSTSRSKGADRARTLAPVGRAPGARFSCVRRVILPSLALSALAVASLVPRAGATTTTTTSTTTAPTSTSTSQPTTTTTTKPVPVAPLTGLPDPTGVAQHRSALTVKIDNTPQAMPQYGIEDADVVYEEIVEGDITRLAAIFNSHLPSVVGPVRSIRRTDREIVFPIGGVFAASGGAEYALRSIATAPVKVYTEANAGDAMFRSSTRAVPHNLFAYAARLMAKDGKPRPPPALFTYRPAGATFPGPAVKSFSVNFLAGYAVSYGWNGATRSWDRSIFGEPDLTANGTRLAPKNVIVMFVNYVGGVGVIDSYAQLIGSGPVDVFSAGHLERGTWTRPNLRHRTVYRTADGQVIKLTPGQTWVELLASSMTVSITTGS